MERKEKSIRGGKKGEKGWRVKKRGGSMIDGYRSIENRADCLPAPLNFTFKFARRKVCVLGFVGRRANARNG